MDVLRGILSGITELAIFAAGAAALILAAGMLL